MNQNEPVGQTEVHKSCLRIMEVSDLRETLQITFVQKERGEQRDSPSLPSREPVLMRERQLEKKSKACDEEIRPLKGT